MFYLRKNDSKDDDFIKRGGSVGANCAFWISLILISLFFLLNIKSREDARMLAPGVPCSIFISFLMVGVGYLLGRSAAKRPSVNSAFLSGAIVSGLFVLLVIYCPFLLLTIGKPLTREAIIFMLLLLAFGVSFGSLLSGISAIYIRDYRKFQRQRSIPQFTLLEFFIVFTILAVIISAMTSIAMLRA
jgi:hypothetical protein